MKYNYSKLRGRIVEMFGTLDSLSEKITMSRTSLFNKICNHGNFTQDEIVELCEILKIDYTEISAYFFTMEVQTA